MEIKSIKEFAKKSLTSGRREAIIEDRQANIYLIDKPKGTTSFRAVAVIRKILDMKRVGFAGTLDPLASGLLIVATGRATRLLDAFHFLPKTYQAKIVFGQTSDTYDLEVEPEINQNVQKFDRHFLEGIIKKFIGRQKQQAPAYSAKKIGGKKLYQLARQGKKISPPSKEVEIYKIEIVDFDFPKLEITVTCSAGTYIRSLAHDIGQASGQGAVLSDLRRTAIGEFSVESSLPLDKADKKTLSKYAISAQEIIKFLDR